MKIVSKNERQSQSLNPEEWLNRTNKEKKFSRFTFEENAFYRDYQQLSIKYLKIEFVVNRRNVREVILEKEEEQPLIEDFLEDREQKLRFIGGHENMLQLIFGELQAIQDIKIVAPKYRMNPKCVLHDKSGDTGLSLKIGQFFGVPKGVNPEGFKYSENYVGLGCDVTSEKGEKHYSCKYMAHAPFDFQSKYGLPVFQYNVYGAPSI